MVYARTSDRMPCTAIIASLSQMGELMVHPSFFHFLA
jgi:hypothetical protein